MVACFRIGMLPGFVCRDACGGPRGDKYDSLLVNRELASLTPSGVLAGHQWRVRESPVYPYEAMGRHCGVRPTMPQIACAAAIRTCR